MSRKPLRQWMLRITAYAERLLDGLGQLDWPEALKAMQTDWIGRSDGAEVDFVLEHAPVTGSSKRVTRLHDPAGHALRRDYMVLAPSTRWSMRCSQHRRRRDRRRGSTSSVARTRNVATSSAEPTRRRPACSPACTRSTRQRRAIPIWIADYVLMGYGTGAIMAVPAHDERDFEFAKKFDLPIRAVVVPADGSRSDGVLRRAPAAP